MHNSVMTFVRRHVVGMDLANQSVLDVGSLDENGSVRPLFTGDYIGMDMRDGPGVDVVANAHQIPFEDNRFDVVVSAEMLEHDDAFWLSLPEMGRVLRPGGVFMLTTRGNGFPEHAYPHDYFRFMPNSGLVILSLAGCEGTSESDPELPGIFVVGSRQ